MTLHAQAYTMPQGKMSRVRSLRCIHSSRRDSNEVTQSHKYVMTPAKKRAESQSAPFLTKRFLVLIKSSIPKSYAEAVQSDVELDRDVPECMYLL